MIYQWFEDDRNCEELSNELGIAVKRISKGALVVGYEEISEQGETTLVPITRPGVEIELEGETAETLDKLDLFFSSLKREGGQILMDRIRQLEADVESLKSSSK